MSETTRLLDDPGRSGRNGDADCSSNGGSNNSGYSNVEGIDSSSASSSNVLNRRGTGSGSKRGQYQIIHLLLIEMGLVMQLIAIQKREGGIECLSVISHMALQPSGKP